MAPSWAPGELRCRITAITCRSGTRSMLVCRSSSAETPTESAGGVLTVQSGSQGNVQAGSSCSIRGIRKSFSTYLGRVSCRGAQHLRTFHVPLRCHSAQSQKCWQGESFAYSTCRFCMRRLLSCPRKHAMNPWVAEKQHSGGAAAASAGAECLNTTLALLARRAPPRARLEADRPDLRPLRKKEMPDSPCSLVQTDCAWCDG